LARDCREPGELGQDEANCAIGSRCAVNETGGRRFGQLGRAKTIREAGRSAGQRRQRLLGNETSGCWTTTWSSTVTQEMRNPDEVL